MNNEIITSTFFDFKIVKIISTNMKNVEIW